MICGKMLFWNRALLNLILNFSCIQIKIGVHFDLYQQNRSNRQEVCRYCWPEGEMVWHWIQVGGYTWWENSGEQSNQLNWIYEIICLMSAIVLNFLKKNFVILFIEMEELWIEWESSSSTKKWVYPNKFRSCSKRKRCKFCI